MVFDKLRNLRGLLYRKVVEKQETTKQHETLEETLPFEMNKPARIIELPDIKDISQLNITYPLMEPFIYANIKWTPERKELLYSAVEPEVTEEEKALIKRVSEAVLELVDIGLASLKQSANAIDYLEKHVTKVVKEFGLTLDKNQYMKLMYYVYRNFIGYNQIEGFLQDPNIEDISCDGISTPMYVVHRKYGSLKTNVTFEDMDDLREFVVKLAERCGRYVSYAEPILDGTLPDGSRVSATLAGDVATRGPTFTIRKFSEKPFSPVDQIQLNTISADMLAYLWYLVEHGSSVLVVGGVATGKTSLLNTISMFIQPEAKIVSIEDTRELRLPHEHWIPGLSRTGFGIPMPTGEKYGEVTLYDLLRESFRQNPDYVIVGEVRGNETYVMFQGMSSGHPSMSTFHAGSVDTVIKRLTTPPIELSPTLLESLDVIVIMTHARDKGKSARRISELVEIVSVDPKTDEVKTNVVFKWDPVSDRYEKVTDSIKIEKVTAARGGSLEEAKKEIERRMKVLEWMTQKDIKDFSEVTKIIAQYYKEPNKVLAMVGAELKPEEKAKAEVKPLEVKTEAKPAARTRTSILDLLGFKVIREKA